MKLLRSLTLVLACLASSAAIAQYPDKPIRMLIPAAPGGGVDLGGRVIAARLSMTLGQPVVPENRAGAGTILATEMLAHSPPDGYTILMVTSSFAVNAALQGGELVVDEAGRRTRDNAAQRSDVALVWPPQSEGEYSLIVDGRAAVEGNGLRITPARAVLHRPSPPREPAAPGACGSDCVELA